MECPECEKPMRQIEADTGLGISVESHYCHKCDVSLTEREALEKMVDKISSKKNFVVSQLRYKGAAS